MGASNAAAESSWQLERLGSFTASEIDALYTLPKTNAEREAGELSVTAKDYVLEKVTEVLTGTHREIKSAATEWGELYEPFAAEALKALYPTMIYYGKNEPRFFAYTDCSGGSPDAVVFEEKLVPEIKCPEDPKNHVKYSLMKTADDLKAMKREYWAQIQFNMMCVAKDIGCDFLEMTGLFASYCPIMINEKARLFTLVIPPDPDFKARMDAVLPKAQQLLTAWYDELNGVA